MKESEKLLFKLISTAICEQNIDVNAFEKVSGQDIESMWKLAGVHSLCPVISAALVNNNLCDGDLRDFFVSEIYRAIRSDEMRTYELKNMCDVLNRERIPHIPLKGVIIKNMYPESWYRTCSDIDILVHKQNFEKTLDIFINQLKYSVIKKDEHDIGLRSPSGIYVELHHKLMESFVFEDKTFPDAWEYSHKTSEESYTYHMCDEMFYLYHIAHMAKHFKYGGFGIRLLIDLWILNHIDNIDYDKRNNLIDFASLKEFNYAVNRLSDIVFLGQESDETYDFFLRFILDSGTHGTKSNEVISYRNNKNKTSYMLSRIFMPYKEFCLVYPELKTKKWLYPYRSVCRWLKILLRMDYKRISDEMKINNSLDERTVKGFKELSQKFNI